MADEKLAVELAAIRERAEVPFDWRTGPSENLARAVAGDVERVLAAVDAVLAEHESRPYYLGADECGHPEPPKDADEWDDWYEQHPEGAGDVGKICLLTQTANYCPACTVLVYDREPSGDDYVSAPCPTRQVITCALLGVEVPDGQGV